MKRKRIKKQRKERLFAQGLKKCPQCDKPKPLSEFTKDKYSKDELNYLCKEHSGERAKEDYEKNKEEILKQRKEYRDKPENKVKKAKYHKEHNSKPGNKIKKAKYDKEWHLKNREERLKQQKEYREENKQYQKEYARNRRKTDIDFKIRGYLRSRLWHALKGRNKSRPTMFLIGCDIDYLMYHIQEQFEPDMSWDNYGLWHIDHIKPCSSFDLTKESEQLKCFNYTNLQPLWAEENIRKGNRYES